MIFKLKYVCRFIFYNSYRIVRQFQQQFFSKYKIWNFIFCVSLGYYIISAEIKFSLWSEFCGNLDRSNSKNFGFVYYLTFIVVFKYHLYHSLEVTKYIGFKLYKPRVTELLMKNTHAININTFYHYFKKENSETDLTRCALPILHNGRRLNTSRIKLAHLAIFDNEMHVSSHTYA